MAFDRRAFLDGLLGSGLGTLLLSVLYPVVRFLDTPQIAESTAVEVDAGASDDPEFRERGFKIVRFGEEPVLVMRVEEHDFRAFSATCTHLDCIVEYQREKRRIWCNCHNGMYDLSGQVVSGPPPRALQPYRVDLVPRGAGRARGVVVSRA